MERKSHDTKVQSPFCGNIDSHFSLSIRLTAILLWMTDYNIIRTKLDCRTFCTYYIPALVCVCIHIMYVYIMYVYIIYVYIIYVYLCISCMCVYAYACNIYVYIYICDECVQMRQKAGLKITNVNKIVLLLLLLPLCSN